MDANHDLEAAEVRAEVQAMFDAWISADESNKYIRDEIVDWYFERRADERRASEEEVLDAHEAAVNAELEAERATTRAEASEERERVLKEAIGNLTCDNCGMLMSDREWSGCIVCQPVRALLIPENAGDA